MSSHPDIVDRILSRKNKDGDTASGTEPPSGVQGRGTVDEAYDQGNAPENIEAQSNQEPISGVQGRGTATQPYDQGNAGESTTSYQPTNVSGSGNTVSTTADSSRNTDERKDRLSAPPRKHSEARDVSPATMPDGSHAQTSGDRGEGYEPAKGLNKLKGKFGLGKH